MGDGGATPFWPWVEIIRSLVDRSFIDPAEIERAGARRAEVAAALADVGRIVPSVARRLSQPPSAPELDPQQARFRLFESISTVLSCAAEKSLVVVVDDAHVADESSLRVLQFVARSMRSWPMLLVVTVRDAATKTTPDAAALLHEIAREGEGITLARLSLSDVEEWLSEQGLDLAGGTASAVFRTTEGNPLFVDETVRFLRSRPREGPLLVPDQVRAAINSHLRLLSDDARAVITVGSALGRSIDARFLAEVLGRDAEAIEVALREARAVRHGWKVVLVWGSVVTNPGTWTESSWRSYLFARNSLYLVRAYFGRAAATLRAILILANTLRLLTFHREDGFAFSARARWKAVRDYFKGCTGRPFVP